MPYLRGLRILIVNLKTGANDMKTSYYSLLFLFVITIFACKNEGGESKQGSASDAVELTAENLVENLQKTLIQAKDGAVISLPEGKFSFQRPLSFNDVPNVTIKGKGMDKTILSFKEQVEGAEGVIIKSAKNITLEGFCVQDTKGDAIKVQNCEDVVMRNLKVTWTGGALKTNGAYGLYPVTCKNVLVENCEASYAMDAGIYVGQTTNFIVRGNYAHHNVAGIEIENSINGDVYDNRATDNTGGLLVFDMPDLPQPNGGNIKIHHNVLEINNSVNFSAEGITVNILPPGTGMLLMAHRDLEVYENEIRGHNTFGLGIISWMFTDRPFKSEEYDPFCSNVNVYKNMFEDNNGTADQTTDFGKLVTGLFKGKGQDIITDGLVSPKHLDDKGQVLADKRVCLRDNGEVSFFNLNAAKGSELAALAKNMDSKIENFDCELASLKLEGLENIK